jgi:hypothetical protein
VTTVMLIDEQPLICGMCGRRLCDITAIDGHVALLYAFPRVGIPQQVPTGYRVKSLGPAHGQTRNPNVRIFADEASGRFRIVHEHKGNGRGPLDRTVSEATLHKLYTDAMTSNAREVVLR